jgi:hypothetical protein
MAERDAKQPTQRPDYLSDFPEEFEQHPDAPSRDLVRRQRDPESAIPRSEPQASGEAQNSALSRIEAMKKRVRDLAANPDDPN